MDRREEKLKTVLAAARKLARDVAVRVAELKQSPDSPERQATLDSYKNALLGVHGSLVRLIAAASKSRDSTAQFLSTAQKGQTASASALARPSPLATIGVPGDHDDDADPQSP